jgi:hypothetical protein
MSTFKARNSALRKKIETPLGLVSQFQHLLSSSTGRRTFLQGFKNCIFIV